ncbi:hydrogenase/urease maturation nickel metallochaperone HypA [Campylobacter sp. IFREMER_LSEM_CL1846]|uniref:hydrogenase maturation nickel metallochaperone HypA/HybF n=1 Tax=Campylobacter sp. IFREMER_LSEM_CL1846 TaxID=2911614 RepID=UPI0021E68408|nr:hydrogenase maturation nickel metallochaperone HypA [Campylobacter sp. IFREMER_LSEM_CL1846]EGK8048554.1 hydrogenase maturation nickel metallochaperone HypA [Campylobacter lari]MCV3345532.1 hydrogenase/urease maturation nickel metallochaperone HypA [Campylobacter lari]MCV3434101.1 hydrogenase/urease maturation nickel metallochaperone HypA [Campylobacter sp. IFREMER_LSEM_CL1846]HEC1748593.1 hydrogenase maturation nickel metallochaperone HypA [Campylobacter lari]HEC1768223.1 hydrogenase matura
MHELSITESLLELCEEYAQEKVIEEVHVKIGRLSGVEPPLLQRSFETFKENSPLCKNAKFIMHIQEVVVECQKCHFSGVLENNIFWCPKCEDKDLKIIDGEELYLMQLVLKENEDLENNDK